MSVAEKLKQIAENEQKVYEAGKEKGIKTEYDRFWDSFQEHGAREYYRYAFAGTGWTEETIKPKYDIVPTNAGNMFVANSVLSGSLKEIFQGITFDLSKSTDCSGMFNSCSEITELPYLDFSSTTAISQVFYGCRKLKSLNIKLPDRELNFLNAFRGLTALESIKIDGTIASDVSFEWSTLLSKESITSVIGCLSSEKDENDNYKVEGKTLTLSETAVSKAFPVDADSYIELDPKCLASMGEDYVFDTTFEDGVAKVTVNGGSSWEEGTGSNGTIIFCSSVPLAAGEYTISFNVTGEGANLAMFVSVGDNNEAIQVNSSLTFLAEEGDLLFVQNDLDGICNDYVITVSVKRVGGNVNAEWEALKASKPNWTILRI